MKKTYLIPASLIVELSFKRNVMLTASDDESGRIIGGGGDGDGTDIGTKESKNIWDEEW